MLMGLMLDNLESSGGFHCKTSYKYVKPGIYSSIARNLFGYQFLKFHASVEPRAIQLREVELVPNSPCLVYVHFDVVTVPNQTLSFRFSLITCHISTALCAPGVRVLGVMQF